MNIIQRTFLINNKYQRCANHYCNLARELNSGMAGTFPSRKFSWLTCYDGLKDTSASRAPVKKISTITINNKINERKLSHSAFPQVMKSKLNLTEYPSRKVS